jgi:hypothetical protein
MKCAVWFPRLRSVIRAANRITWSRLVCFSLRSVNFVGNPQRPPPPTPVWGMWWKSWPMSYRNVLLMRLCCTSAKKIMELRHSNINITCLDSRPRSLQIILSGPELIFWDSVVINVCWDRVVDISSHYGLDGPGVESRWRRYFTHQSRPFLGPHPASYTVGTGSLSRG